MAELPDLEYLLKVFSRELSGKKIQEAECLMPERLHMALEGDFGVCLSTLSVTKVRRRGPYIILRTDGDERLVINPGIGGHFKFPGLGTRRPRTLVFAIHMVGGPRLWFLDPDGTSQVYLTTKDQLEDVPNLMTQGADPLGKNFTPERLRRIAKKKAKIPVRAMLMDQNEISHIGDVFADEILFEAGIHPNRKVKELSEDDLDRLYDATVDVLENACAYIEERGQPIENTVRDFLKVYGREGQPCPVTGDSIQTIKINRSIAYFSPRVQVLD